MPKELFDQWVAQKAQLQAMIAEQTFGLYDDS